MIKRSKNVYALIAAFCLLPAVYLITACSRSKVINKKFISNTVILEKDNFSLNKRLPQDIEHDDVANDDKFLINHPVFKTFNLTLPDRKKKVRLLLIVSTAPQRYDRREAIRKTWWTQCVNQV